MKITQPKVILYGSQDSFKDLYKSIPAGNRVLPRIGGLWRGEIEGADFFFAPDFPKIAAAYVEAGIPALDVSAPDQPAEADPVTQPAQSMPSESASKKKRKKKRSFS